MQQDKQGKCHPVVYFSATLTKAERNYDIFSLELYAIIQALCHWQALVAGSPETIIIHTNHANLQYWKEPHKILRRIMREVMELEEYNFKLVHIKGRENRRADMLSRWPSYNQGEEDNKGVVVLPEHLFVQTAHMITYEPEEPPLQDEAILCPWIQTHDLKKVKGEWWKGTKKVVTQGTEEKRRILQAYHDLPAYGPPWNQLNIWTGVQILLVAKFETRHV